MSVDCWLQVTELFSYHSKFKYIMDAVGHGGVHKLEPIPEPRAFSSVFFSVFLMSKCPYVGHLDLDFVHIWGMLEALTQYLKPYEWE